MWCDVDPDKVSSLQSNDDEDKEQVEQMVGATNRSMAAVGDVERIEINEAFAAVPLAVAQELGLPADIINVEGGAIAHGHPIGATGAVLTTRLLHSMRRDGLERGIVTLCIGGGQGIALALETIA
jgi:acetyl-CoA C-acetyltransferase